MIKETVDDFLDLVTIGASDAASRLPLLLDRLALAVGTATFIFDDKDWPDPELTKYDEWRSRAETTFPELGYYNAARPLSENIGKSDLVVGDAIDDIADIAGDLEIVSLRWSSSTADALWHLEFSFLNHWGEHLRNLQLYLHMKPLGQ